MRDQSEPTTNPFDIYVILCVLIHRNAALTEHKLKAAAKGDQSNVNRGLYTIIMQIGEAETGDDKSKLAS